MKWKIIIFIALLVCIQTASATPLGFEVVNGSWHMWNEKDSYYFNMSNGLMLTNVYEDYWSTNQLCLKNNLTEYCLESTNFVWTNDTDETSFAWLYGQYDILQSYIWINYSLSNNNTEITIDVGFENNNVQVINNSKIEFEWRISNIDIPDEAEDVIVFDDWIERNISNDVIYFNTENFTLRDKETSLFIYMTYYNNYTNNYYIHTLSNVSIVMPYNKTYQFTWIDAECDWTCDLTDPTTNEEYEQGSSFNQDGTISYTGTCNSAGAYIEAQHNSTKTLSTGTSLTTGDTNSQSASCLGGTCNVDGWQIDADEIGNHTVRNKCGFNRQIKYSGTKNANVTSPGAISSCDYIQLGTNLVLTADNHTCFNVTTDDIIINCSGYKMEALGFIRNNWTIISHSNNNLTIIDCNFQGWAKTILLNNTHNSTIENCTFFNITDFGSGEVNARGITLETAKHNVIENSNFSLFETQSSTSGHCGGGNLYAINMYKFSNNNTFRNNLFYDINGTHEYDTDEAGGCQAGIEDIGTVFYVSGTSENSTYYKNDMDMFGKYGINIVSGDCQNITTNNFTDGITAISVSSGADYGCVDYNAVSNMKEIGFNLQGNIYNLSGNLIEATGKSGIIVSATTSGHITDNVIQHINTTDGSGLSLTSTAGYTFVNNTIYNVTTISDASAGLYLLTGSVQDINLTNVSSCNECLYLDSATNNFYDSIIENCKNNTIRVGVSDSNNNFYNTTINLTDIYVSANGEFKVYHYLRTNVTNSSYDRISGAEVNYTSFYNTSVNVTTNSDGLTNFTSFVVFNATATAHQWWMPYNVTANYTGYLMNSTSTNMTDETTVQLTLESSSVVCWIYDAVSKFLHIPNDCLFETNELYTI